MRVFTYEGEVELNENQTLIYKIVTISFDELGYYLWQITENGSLDFHSEMHGSFSTDFELSDLANLTKFLANQLSEYSYEKGVSYQRNEIRKALGL